MGQGDRHLEPVERLIVALSAAEDAVSRLDERIRSSLGEGLKVRLEFHQACDWSWNRGALVHLEDLILHDEELDVRTPDQELTRTHAVLRLWRRAGQAKPADLLSPGGVYDLINPRRRVRSSAVAEILASAGDAGPGREIGADDGAGSGFDQGMGRIEEVLALAEAVTAENDESALEFWFSLEGLIPARLPALLRVAVLLEAWMLIDPVPRQSHLSSVLADAILRRAGRLAHHRLHAEIGRRRLGPDVRRPVHGTRLARVVWQLKAIEAGETFALEEHDRLSLARQVVSRGLARRRSSSRLAEAIELFTTLPIVTAPVMAHRLKVSQQAARGLIGQLGASVAEVSGRARFRAWRL